MVYGNLKYVLMLQQSSFILKKIARILLFQFQNKVSRRIISLLIFILRFKKKTCFLLGWNLMSSLCSVDTIWLIVNRVNLKKKMILYSMLQHIATIACFLIFVNLFIEQITNIQIDIFYVANNLNIYFVRVRVHWSI